MLADRADFRQSNHASSNQFSSFFGKSGSSGDSSLFCSASGIFSLPLGISALRASELGLVELLLERLWEKAMKDTTPIIDGIFATNSANSTSRKDAIGVEKRVIQRLSLELE